MASEAHDHTRREGMRQYGFGPDVMKEIKVCVRCGAVSPASYYTCDECKAVLPHNTLFQVYKSRHPSCGSCETVVPDGSRYCPACGKKISSQKG